MIVRYLFFDPRISFCHKGFYDLINCLSKLSIAKKVDEGKRLPFLASGCLGFSTGGVVDKKPRWEYSWVSSILVAEVFAGARTSTRTQAVNSPKVEKGKKEYDGSFGSSDIGPWVYPGS
jgi:hypothetical protein